MFLAPLHLLQDKPYKPVLSVQPKILRPLKLGQLLVQRGALGPGDLTKALALQVRENVRLGDILLTHGMVSEADLYETLAEQYNAQIVDLIAHPPDCRLIDMVGVETCLKKRFVPWRRVGNATVITTAHPEEFEQIKAELPPALQPALLAIAPERDVLDALVDIRSSRLIHMAETKVAENESCRSWNGRQFRHWAVAVLAMLLAGGLIAPAVTFGALTFLAMLALFANLGLRVGALATGAWRELDPEGEKPPRTSSTSVARLPVVSIFVPLFHEKTIAERLVMRLGRISYPKELLDICFVTEESDDITRETLARTELPRWLRVITVPEGTLQTKPRALNYSLNFCRGSIIGIYDAEDAPAPDQIHRVVKRFHERGPDVACLQGVLDFYNARSGWMARCFTLEYASWFRVILPGIEKLGLAIPLGGTTLFLRREAIEAVGGWDSYNVTEDADLGVRLARYGYRSELIGTVTEEEANTRPWSWVRQRSRWIKGYAMTWAVHMRDPRKLWKDLGARKFWGVQLLFGGSLLQGILAPVLWSYWLILFGLPHPLSGVLSTFWAAVLSYLFIASFAVNLSVMLVATSGKKHRHLMAWAPTTDFYFPLATLASVKALIEMVAKPFYWDKTTHGLDDEAEVLVKVEQSVAVPKMWVPPSRPALADPIAAGFTPQEPSPSRPV